MPQLKKADRERAIEVIKNNSDQIEVEKAKFDLSCWYYSKTMLDLQHIANIPFLDMLFPESGRGKDFPSKNYLAMFSDDDLGNDLLDHLLQKIGSARDGLDYLENGIKAEQESRRKRKILNFKIVDGR